MINGVGCTGTVSHFGEVANLGFYSSHIKHGLYLMPALEKRW